MGVGMMGESGRPDSLGGAEAKFLLIQREFLPTFFFFFLMIPGRVTTGMGFCLENDETVAPETRIISPLEWLGELCCEATGWYGSSREVTSSTCVLIQLSQRRRFRLKSTFSFGSVGDQVREEMNSNTLQINPARSCVATAHLLCNIHLVSKHLGGIFVEPGSSPAPFVAQKKM